MDDIIIRTAVPDDAETLLEIYAPYVNETAITFEYTVPEPDEFKNRIRHTLEKYPYYVAETGGKAVGYAYAGPFKGRAAYDWAVETTVYIHRDMKRSGIGKKLYEQLQETLSRQGILNMYACIASPREDNTFLTADSIRFHEKMGFHTVGRFSSCGYKFNQWYDMIWMEKLIGEHKLDVNPIIPFPLLNDYE